MPTEQLPDTITSDLLTASSTTATNLQTVPNSVPHRYPQRTQHPPTKYNSYPYC